MNVLLITRYFPPLDAIATHRMYAWARYLDRLGCSVTVLTTDKEGQVVVPWNWDVSDFELVELPYWDPISAAGVTKEAGLGEQSGIKGALKAFYRQRMNERMPSRTDPWLLPARRWIKDQTRTFDYIISSYGPPVCHLLGHYAQKHLGGLWIADYRDLWIENHVFAGLWPFTLVERVLERWCVGKADRITTVSQPLAHLLQKKFPKVPVDVIENGFEPKMIDAASADYFVDHTEKFRIVYTGSIYSGKRDPRPLFNALRELVLSGDIRRDQVEVCFYGSQSGDLADLVRDSGIADMIHYGEYVSQEDAYSIQKSADLLLFLEAPSPGIDGILTGKLFEYLYADTPILAVGVGLDTSAGQLIQEATAGKVCGTDVARIKDAISDFMQGWRPEKNHACVMRYSREAQVERLYQLMHGMRREACAR